MRRHARAALGAFMALALAASACSSSDGDGGAPTPTTTAPPAANLERTDATFAVRGSVEQVAVTDGEPGARLVLVDADDRQIDEGTVDELGGLIFRGVDAGEGYLVQQAGDGPVEASARVTVLSPEAHPDQAFYDAQTLEPGFGYLRTRDGTTLSINVILPGPPEDGPYPTVVEYSGYSPSRPDEPQPGSLIAAALGYAAVGVNIRGTGCSGGAFDFFEELQLLDGYDVIETVAAQDWAKGNRVGMVGLSYPGITQLFVASTQPPSLAAITPLSIIDDSYQGTLYPGGILNTGFAVSWIDNVGGNAVPGGQGWDQRRIDEGDETCAENTKLRGQNPDFLAAIDEGVYYVNETGFLHYGPDQYTTLAPARFADRITVPVFMAGAWQDEQTGGHFPAMLDSFTASADFDVTLYNGAHSDGFAPEVIVRWAEFLELYVDREVPDIPDSLYTLAPAVMAGIFGVPVDLPPSEFGVFDTYDDALTAWQAQPAIRVLFESGGGEVPGAPQPTFTATFPSWPPPDTTVDRWYLGPDGMLSVAEPGAGDGSPEGADEFSYDPASGEVTFHRGGSIFSALPDYDWPPLAAGLEAAYLSAPLEADALMLGHASADLWIQSTAPDTDLEVVLTEVRPDGQEVYVTAGWLRASMRSLDEEASTELRPQHTFRWDDAADLPADTWSAVRVELFPFGHAFREGSRIRVSVGSPGGNRPTWAFRILQPGDDVTNRIAHSAAYPSSIVLPVISGVDVPAALPACPGLRAQPCRPFVEYANTSSPD